MKRVFLALFVAAAWLLAPTFVAAQGVSTSQLSGVVRDSSGGVLPGATVTALQTDTGVTRTAVTGSDGTYALLNLPVGPYKLTVTLEGFSTYAQEGIVLQVQSNPTVDVTLGLGTLDESLTVSANAGMVETRSTAVGQVIDNSRVIEMPLNGRQATELVFLSGLATDAPAADLNTNKNYPTVTISVAGGQANGMTYIMDGGTYNDPFNNLNLPTPNPDALQEFKVESSALPARYGHHAASAVNVVTKSGSNDFRGNAFGFLRDYHLNAKNALTTTRDSLERKQFGGTLGGPIVRNKLLFFGAYQGTLEKTAPSDITVFTPTQAMLNGDFTAFASAACQSRGAVTLRAPFVNNRIDPALFSKAAVSILKFVPVATDPCGRFQYGVPNDNSEHQALGRLDYQAGQNHSFMSRYMFARYENAIDWDGKNVLQITRTGRENIVHSLIGGHNWILGAKAVNALHLTFNKTLNDRPLPEYFAPKDVGIAVDAAIPGYMGLSITSAFNLGAGGTNPGYFNSTGFQIADDFDYILGKHQIAVGVSYIRTSIEATNNRPTNGAFTFNGSNTGLGLADFMVGRMSSFLQGNQVWDYHRHNYFGMYIQDDWKPRGNLTINYGLRWEPFIPIQNEKAFSNNFNMEWFRAGTRSTVYPQAPAGLMFPGDAGYPEGTGTHGARWGQVAPRVGVIWSPLEDNSMSVRAAYGWFYDTPHLFFNTRFANSPPWGAQLTLTNPAGGLDNPWLNIAGGNPWPNLRDNWATSAFPLAGTYVTTPLDLHNTRTEQWNVSVQKGFGDYLFAATYLGTRGKYVWRATELNPAVFATGATTGNTQARRTLTAINPTWGPSYSTVGSTDDTGKSRYNGLLLSAQKRMSDNWSLLTNYTLSKCMTDPATTEITGSTIMNPDNPDADYSYCSSDRRHVWNVSAVFRAPTVSGGLGALISDWQIAPIVRVQSGNRSTVTTGTDVALTGMGNQRAVQILDDPYGAKTAANYLNPAAFAAPATGTYSSDKPFTILNPGRLTNDISVSRTFRIASTSLQFRWEVFNVINHVNLDAPIVALNNANFGRVLTAGDPRIMQLALKYTF